MEVAAEHAEREGVAAGKRVVERLLLDRVDLQAGDVAERHAQLAVGVEAHAADAGAAGHDQAAVPAGQATHGVAFGADEVGLAGMVLSARSVFSGMVEDMTHRPVVGARVVTRVRSSAGHYSRVVAGSRH